MYTHQPSQSAEREQHDTANRTSTNAPQKVNRALAMLNHAPRGSVQRRQAAATIAKRVGNRAAIQRSSRVISNLVSQSQTPDAETPQAEKMAEAKQSTDAAWGFAVDAQRSAADATEKAELAGTNAQFASMSLS